MYIPHFAQELDQAQYHLAETQASDDEAEEPTQTENHNIRTLNVEQKTAYDIICRHQEQLIAHNNPTPLRMIVCGTAGTGKLYLICAIANTLGTRCVLTGTTGMAAFHICGKTLHSTLQLPICSSTYRELQGSSLH